VRNPLTEFSGQEFLVFFAILIVIVAAFCWRRKRTQDSSLELAPLDAPEEIDPYEIAYLRGGENELARVLIVSLIERKYLRIVAPESKWWKTKSASRIQQDPEHPDSADLQPIERAGFAWFDSARTAEDVFKKSIHPVDLPSSLSSYAATYERKLRAERLLTSDELKSKTQKNIVFGLALILLIGFTRLLIGIARERPVGFLILMGIAGVVVVVRAGLTGRLSWRGQEYLERTRTRWSWLHDSNYGGWSPSLAAGVFGYAVLSGTELSPLNDMFRRANAGNYYGSSDGGGACGTACGGGDGGGGGCGGCGGCSG
jgi:uncharacterized protein (TIGR04222 family)